MPSKDAILHAKNLATCQQCGCEFPVFQSEVNRGRRFCSRACANPSTIEQRIKSFTTTEPSGCIVWIGGRHERGYGLTSIKHKTIRVHRLVWEIANGPIANGLFVLHKCDNPPCCNIEHLFLGTSADNVRDKMAKNRHISPRGEQANHKLTESQVIEIIGLKGTATLRKIAGIYGVSESSIHHIFSGKRWSHIQRST